MKNFPRTKEPWLLCLLGLCLFFTGNQAIFITDPVESNYALTALEMLQSGDYLSPQIYGNYWYDKPVFFYWQLAAAFKLFGATEFAARFWPALMGIIGLLLTYFFGQKLYGRKIGFGAALILGTSFEYWLIAKLIVTDMSLFVFFNGVLIFFYLAYRSDRKAYYYFAYVAAGLATLTKGPIGFLLPGLIICLFLLWRRNFAEIKRMKLLSGGLLFVFISGSWYYLMYTVHGSDFVMTFFGVHNFLRATVSEHPDFNVWYYYSVIFLLGFFPWNFALLASLRKYRPRRLQIDETTGFLLLWVAVIALFYQCMATKYSTYTFPYLLPLALLTAKKLADRPKLVKRLVACNCVLYLALTFAIAIPYCQNHSQKKLGNLIAENYQPGMVVASYGNYHTSAVFYSRIPIYRLAKSEDIAKMQPQAMSWSSKNVMPFLAEESLADKANILVLVDDDFMTTFRRDLPGNWQTIGTAYYEHLFMK